MLHCINFPHKCLWMGPYILTTATDTCSGVQVNAMFIKGNTIGLHATIHSNFNKDLLITIWKLNVEEHVIRLAVRSFSYVWSA